MALRRLRRRIGAPRHSWLGREKTLAAIPGLRQDGLSGAFLYRDARTDDARMVLEVLHAAAGAGAAVANYLSMEGLLSVKGRAAGVGALDHLSGETMEVQARVVVLATGVWLDRVAPPTGRGDGCGRPRACTSSCPPDTSPRRRRCTSPPRETGASSL